jgi:AcrR family transcriptional regulator
VGGRDWRSTSRSSRVSKEEIATAESGPRQFQQLPRGRHRLPREAVAASQRGRILQAMAEAVGERGYANVRVADVIAAAGVSRKTFYELFDDREDCFLAAFDFWQARLLRMTSAGFEASAEAPWTERIRVGLTAFLAGMAEQPAAARLCIVEVLAAGPEAVARRDAAIQEFARFLDLGRAEGAPELPETTALSVAGGISELLYSEINRGATTELPGLLPELVFWIVRAFRGEERAGAERDRARRLMAEGEAGGPGPRPESTAG